MNGEYEFLSKYVLIYVSLLFFVVSHGTNFVKKIFPASASNRMCDCITHLCETSNR